MYIYWTSKQSMQTLHYETLTFFTSIVVANSKDIPSNGKKYSKTVVTTRIFNSYHYHQIMINYLLGPNTFLPLHAIKNQWFIFFLSFLHIFTESHQLFTIFNRHEPGADSLKRNPTPSSAQQKKRQQINKLYSLFDIHFF